MSSLSDLTASSTRRRNIFRLVGLAVIISLVLFIVNSNINSSTTTPLSIESSDFTPDDNKRSASNTKPKRKKFSDNDDEKEIIIKIDPAKMLKLYSMTSVAPRKDQQRLRSGVCYPNAHRIDIWNPVNCPDDATWLRHWLRARFDILKYSVEEPNKAKEVIENYPNFAKQVLQNQIKVLMKDQEQSSDQVHQGEEIGKSSSTTATEKNLPIKNDWSYVEKLSEQHNFHPLKHHPYAKLNEWLVVDVGANKGFTISRWTESLIGASRSPYFNSFRLLQEAYDETGAAATTTTSSNGETSTSSLPVMNTDEHFLFGTLPVEKRSRVSSICGACCDCVDDVVDFDSDEEFEELSPFGKFQKGKSFFGNENNKNNSNVPVKFLGFEPVRDNFDFLKKFFVTGDEIISSMQMKKTKVTSPVKPWQKMGSTKHIILDDSQEKYFSITHADNTNEFSKYFDIRFAAASVSSSHGKRAKFRTGPFGVETFSFKTRVKPKKGAAARKEVPVAYVNLVALDNVLLAPDSPYKDRYIDILTTDTEGFDLDVARGAESLLLRSNRVKMYIFEMHQKADYRRVFRNLANANYECYYPVQPAQRGVTLELPHLVKITGYGDEESSSSSLKNVSKIVSWFEDGGDDDEAKKCWTRSFGRLSGWFNSICASKVSAPELVEILGQLTRKVKKSQVPCGTRDATERALIKAHEWIQQGKRT